MRVEQLEQEYDVEVEWKGFEIHPELPPGGIPSERLQGEYFRQAAENVRWLAAEAGVVMCSPSILANTHLALEAAEFARERGVFTVLHRRLFEAYFHDGVNIGDPEALVKLAEEAGLDGEELRRALTERRYRAQLEEVTREARELGIDGTPTFIIGNLGVVGAQPYEVLRRAAIEAGARPRLPEE